MTPPVAPPGPRLPLAWRIFLGTSLVVAIVLGGALAWTARFADQAAAVGAARGVAALDAEVAAYLDGDGRALRDGALVFARAAGFRAVVAGGAPADALDQAREAAEQLGAAWVQVLDARGVRLAKSDAPTAAADPLGGSPLVDGALAGRPGAAYGSIGDSALAHVVAVPVEGATPGRTVGVLMVARPLDARAARTGGTGGGSGGDVVFYVLPRDLPPRVAASTLPSATLAAAPELAATLAALPGVRGAAEGGPQEVTADGTRYLARAHPLQAATGRAVGGYAVLRGRDVELAAFAALRRATVIAGGVGLLAALLVSFVIARQVTRPLAALAEAARRAAAGDYQTTFAARVGRDEVGVLAGAFHTLLDDLLAKQVLVEFARLTRGPTGRSRASGERRRATPPRPMTPPEPTVRFGQDGQLVPPPPAGSDGASGTSATPAPAPGPAPEAVPVDAVEAAAALSPGELFADRYLVDAMIGAGGSGVVFRVRDTARADGVLALKVLRPDVAQQDPLALTRLRREVETARELAHPNVVRTFDAGEADGIHYLTMEYVEGKSLRALVQDGGPLPVRAAVEAARQVCRALAHAHAHGVLHRDVTSHNAILTPSGVLKITDFGTARFADVPRGVTETGTLVGTPAFMAPEVLRGQPHDVRADVYAVGVVLYECLTGHPPFAAAGGLMQVLAQVLETEPEDPCTLRRDMPRALCDLVLASIAKDPAERPASAEAFERRLAALA